MKETITWRDVAHLAEHNDKIRIVQETVAGKEITFAHVIGGPAPIIYQKLGLNQNFPHIEGRQVVSYFEFDLGNDPTLESSRPVAEIRPDGQTAGDTLSVGVAPEPSDMDPQ